MTSGRVSKRRKEKLISFFSYPVVALSAQRESRNRKGIIKSGRNILSNYFPAQYSSYYVGAFAYDCLACNNVNISALKLNISGSARIILRSAITPNLRMLIVFCY